MLPPPRFACLAFAPWRLSGAVYGSLLNDPATLAALGDAASAPPYKAPPRAPVLYVKPRNTLAASGSTTALPGDADTLEIGASLALVVARTACRVAESDAMACIAGWTLVADLSVPHDSFYRPGVRFRALDGSCLIGPQIVPRQALASPDDLQISVTVAGEPPRRFCTAGRSRPVARLLHDVSEFMTLQPGDLLLLGVAAGAPRAAAGQGFSIEAPGLGRLIGHVTAAVAEQDHRA